MYWILRRVDSRVAVNILLSFFSLGVSVVLVFPAVSRNSLDLCLVNGRRPSIVLQSKTSICRPKEGEGGREESF